MTRPEHSPMVRRPQLRSHLQAETEKLLQEQEASGKTRMVDLTERQELIAPCVMVAIDGLHKQNGGR